MTDESEDKITESSGNVFADLDLPNPEERLIKAKIIWRIADAIRLRGLSQGLAASLLGFDQSRLSTLLRGHATEYSAEQLTDFLKALESD